MKSKNKSRGKKIVSVASMLSPQKVNSILRELPLSLAFHFHEDVGRPTGHVAKSLVEFCDKLALNQPSVPAGSFAFHVKRGDFAAWTRQAVGDAELANTIAQINPDDANARENLCRIVSTRIDQLKRTLIEYSVIPEDQSAVIRT